LSIGGESEIGDGGMGRSKKGERMEVELTKNMPKGR